MLNVTKKTFYALAIVGVACSMAQAFFILSGLGEAALLGNISLLVVGLSFCMLASVHGTDKRRKKQLVFCTVLLLFSTAQLTPLVNYLLLALVWPYFAWIEQDGSERMRRPFGAILAIEVVCFALRLAVGIAGITALGQVSNLCWLLAIIARGWLLVECYRREVRML